MNARLAVFGLALAACVGPTISENRMVFAPGRPAGCDLQLVQVNAMQPEFLRRWDLLGYVLIANNGVVDPAASENRERVRPRACAMGGTAVAVGMNALSQNAFGARGGGVVYMVLRPKSWTQGPTKF